MPQEGTSQKSHLEPPTPLVLVIVQRLLALCLLGIVGYTLHGFPVAREAITIGLGIYLILLWWFPWLWLIVIPTLLPVLDLTPSTGRIFFGEFDLLLLSTCAAGLLRKDPWVRPLDFSRGTWLLIWLLVFWQSYSTLNGLLPLQPIDANAFTSYYSHYNSLRIAKGFFWALLLLPLLGQAIGREESVVRLFIVGMLGGLVANLMAILWERALFTGLFNFSKPYRVTAFFSGMTTGGAPLDAHLVISLPFVAALFLVWRSLLSYTLGFLLLLVSLYGLAVTFSRIDYAAIAAIILTGLVAWLILRRSTKEPHAHNGRFLVGIIVVALLTALPIFTGNYIQQRFETVGKDLKGRIMHWKAANSMMGNSWQSRLFGMGKGSFPRSYYSDPPVDNFPSTMLHLTEGGNGFIRMGKSAPQGNLFLTQRFDIPEPGPYRLAISLRPRIEKQVRLLIEICERLIFQPYEECRWIGINTHADSNQWMEFNKSFSVNGLGEGSWYGHRPVQISILNRGLAEGIDIDNVQIITPGGKLLLRNSGFTSGLDHWFFYSGDHRSWHIDNIWLDVFFEGGWIGISIFMIFIFSLLHHALRRLTDEDSFSLILLPAITGVLVVGMLNSFLDDPRLGLLFFFTAWLFLNKTTTSIAFDYRKRKRWAYGTKYLCY